MSSTPRTDALDAKHKAQLDAMVKAVEAGAVISLRPIFEQAKEMLIAYGLLCAELEKALATGNKLDRPALVGNTRFGVGIKWETVIERAQRQHDYEVTPEKEAARLARVRAFLAWDVEAVKQEIRDLFARYGSGDYVPTEEEKGIIEAGLDEILCTPAGVAESPIFTDFLKGTNGR